MKLRYRLIPTIYSSFHKAASSGLPLVSSLAISYPLDQKIYQSDYQNQYIFCNTFLVAPVESTKEIVKVYLPKGNWYSIYSDIPYSGEQEIYVDTPINYLPVFVKGASIFTMQSDISFSDQKNDGILRIHIYAGNQDGSFEHYEDDGISHAYENGHFHKRTLSYFSDEEKVVISKVAGSFKSEYETIKCYFHGFDIDKININNESLELETENYAFLGKLTEFDPLPENEHPYYEIKELAYIHFKNKEEEITITGLKK